MVTASGILCDLSGGPSGILCDLSGGPIVSGITLKSSLQVMIDIKIQIAWGGTSVQSASEGALGMLR